MNRPSISFLAVLATSILVSSSWAEDGMISTVDATRAGLTVDWTTQVDISASGGKIVDIQLNVNENRSHTFFAIVYGSQREIISEYDIGPFGVPFGTNASLSTLDPGLRNQIEVRIRETQSDFEIHEELGIEEETVAKVRQEIIDRVDQAQESAKNRQERLIAMMKIQNREVEVKLEKFTLPESTIYVTTSTGFVQAIDADTGLTRWTNSVGNRNYPTIGLGASNDHVAIINGSSLYCLQASTGKQLWKAKCRGSVGSSPVVSKNLVFVPLVNGRLEAFPIDKSGVGSESYVSIGRARSRPLVTEESICWATDKGYFTVASNEEVDSPHYRLRAEASIVAPGTSRDGKLFVAATDGFAYAIDEATGSLLWEFSTGQRLLQSAIPMGQYVYLITDENMMFKLYAKTGVVAPGWDKPIEGVKKYVGASKDKIYVQNKIGQVVAISQSNGALLSAVSSQSTNLVLPNYQSDRLYVGNGSGSVQCLRESSSEIPYFHADEVTELAGDNPADAMPGQEATPKTDPFGNPINEEKSTDPFGDDPFGSDKKKPAEKKEDKKDPTDPFGGSDDPFGG